MAAARKSRIAASTQCFETMPGSAGFSHMTGSGKGAKSFRGSGFLTRPRWCQEMPTSLQVSQTPFDGYGYQLWIEPGSERRFVLRVIRGQFVFVDPKSKLVMVHTAVRQKANDPANAETRALWHAVVQQLGN